MDHTGKAVVFEDQEDLANRIDDPDLDVGPEDILVMKNAGPKGAPGMPESGYLPIPKKLATAGVKDMIRMSDARMSGTAFGSIVLHITPESAAGGPLGLVQNGDWIKLDVPNRRLDLLVDEAEMKRRRAARCLNGANGFLAFPVKNIGDIDVIPGRREGEGRAMADTNTGTG